MRKLFTVQYGSKLYGTSTPASDTDLKVVYLPKLADLLMLRHPKIFKDRVDADGQPVPDKSPMPDGGTETEYFPFQTFVRDFVQGQTYALEMAWATLQGFSDLDENSTEYDESLLYNRLLELVHKFGNKEVYSMVGFAMKQTMDYVTRGERLNDARRVYDSLEAVLKRVSHIPLDELRLDDEVNELGEKVLDVIARETGLPIGKVENNGRAMRTLELNGRSYLETSAVQHVKTAITKLIQSYGERSNAASKTDVDFKSLSHAVRVYQQSIELLDAGKITFPRPNAEYLLTVKQGKADMEEVKDVLRALDKEVQEKIKTSPMREKTPELVADAELWLTAVLQEMYDL